MTGMMREISFRNRSYAACSADRYSIPMPDSQPRLRSLMRRKLSSGVRSRCTIRLGRRIKLDMAEKSSR